MGTHSLTIFKDGKDEILVMYRQFDGYCAGHGAELLEILKDKQLVNGLPCGAGDPQMATLANGMPCLAATVIAHFKKGPGSFYLHRAKMRDAGEEYRYTVYDKDDIIYLKVQAGYGKKWETLYDGPAKDFDPEKAEPKEKA